MVVVLPVRFTPTTRTTWGLRVRSRISGLATGSRMSAISSASACLISGSVTLRPKRFLRKASTISAAAAGPRSAPNSNSSSSSSAASSSVRFAKAAEIPLVSFSVERVSPVLSLLKKPPSAIRLPLPRARVRPPPSPVLAPACQVLRPSGRG